MILIVGATGQLGGRITQQLLEQNRDVRILLRHNSPSSELAKQGLATDAQTLIDAGAEPIYGDLKDRASLDEACKGIDTIITTANSVQRGGEDTLVTVDLNGTTRLIDAAQAAGVRHFIYTSADGVHTEHPHPLFQAKGVCEAHLKASGMTYTNLKPGAFMETWIAVVVGMPLAAEQSVTLVGKGERKQIFVSISDVADYAVAAVDNPLAANQDIPIAGQASYSWTEVLEAFGQQIGMEIPVNYVSPREPIPLIPEGMAPILTALEMDDSYIDMTDTSARYGITPTSLESYIEHFLQRALAPS